MLSRSVKHRASYISRTVPNAEVFAESYDKAIEDFLRTLFQQDLSEDILRQAELPISFGGLGLSIKSKEYCENQYRNSKCITYPLVRHITHQEAFNLDKNTNLKNSIINVHYYFDISVQESILRLRF